MAIRFTSWVSSVLAQLAGGDVAAGDRIAIYDASAGAHKYVDADDFGLIPAIADLVAGAGYTDEQARDAIGTALVAGEGIDITVVDGSDTITIDAEDASTTNEGIVELATDAETIAKSDTARVITPSNLAAIGSSATFAGLVELATDAEAITGTDTARATTPANVKAAASSGTLTDAGSLITATTIEAGLQEAFNGSFSVNTNATTGSTETLTLQPAHKMTMDQNCTFTFPTPTTAGHTFQLWLLGAFTPTFPASVDWHSGAAPTYANDSLYVFTTLDTGTTWLGTLVASALA
jgi:hypothetical protein